MERSVSVRWAIALIALASCLAAARAMASGSAHRHHRTHHLESAAPSAASPSVAAGAAPSITLSPSAIKRSGAGAFTTSIRGAGFAADMPVTINTSALDAACSKTGVRPELEFGAAIPGATKVGTDGQWLARLDGLQCRPGVYAVAVQEQALPYQTFVATLTVTL